MGYAIDVDQSNVCEASLNLLFPEEANYEYQDEQFDSEIPITGGDSCHQKSASSTHVFDPLHRQDLQRLLALSPELDRLREVD
jgi:hypothetical protein